MTFRALKPWLMSLLILFTLVPATGFTADGDADFAYAAGYFKKQRWKYAAEALNDFIEKYPRHARIQQAQLYYGLSLNSLDQYEPARKQLRKYIAEYPTSQNVADARFHIGECSYNLRDHKSAIETFSEYLDKHKTHNLHGWASLMLGESYNELSQWKNAEQVLTPYLASSPDARIVPDATFALGVSLQGLKRSTEAIERFQQVIELKAPELVHRAYARIGTVHFNNDSFAEASKAYDLIVSRFPEKSMAATAALQSGISQFQLKQFDEALKRLKSVPSETKASRHAAMWRGFCYRELGQLDTARKELSDAYAAAGDSPLAAEILFNRAQIEVLGNEKSTAAQMFMDLADRWPENSRVAESLLNAAQLKVETADLETAQRILTRLQDDYPDNAQQPSVKVLTGRLLLNLGKTEEAIIAFRSAAENPADDNRENLFRNYHLIRALHRGEHYEESIAVFEKNHDLFTNTQADGFFGAISLAAMSCLELNQFAKAEQFASEFITLEKKPEKKSDALAARSVAWTHLNEFDKSLVDLNALIRDYPENKETWRAVLQSAESAWKQEKYDFSAMMFALAVNDSVYKSSIQIHESAVSGAAWCRYKLGQFPEAAELFRQANELHADSENANESAYMEALSYFDAGEKNEAAERFLALYEKLEQQTGDVPYLRDAGQMYARLLGEADKVDEADQMWERLSRRFVEAKDLDDIMDAWAYLNLKHGRYERSDQIYRQLLKDFPDSKHAGLARLSLAESEMDANRLDTALLEFTSIATTPEYGEGERESALYHVIDIHAAQREWQDVLKYGKMFAEHFSTSDHAPNVQLLYAEALLDQQDYAAARQTLTMLRKAVVEEALPADPWTERIWVVLAEVALADAQYADIDGIADELKQRVPESKILFQLADVQGRRWKSQAPPNFERSREYLTQVTVDKSGRGTQTAARCQFLIGETWLLEEKPEAALKEYYRVYLSYPFDEWRERALFQAAACEVALGDIDAAKRSYEDFLKEFSESELAADVKERLKQLTK